MKNEKTLKSGARVIFVNEPSEKLSLISAWVNVGAREDIKGKEGLAHFFEHVLMKKTKMFPIYQDRLNFLAEKGIQFNAYTGSEYSYYYHLQRKEATSESLEVFVDGMFSSEFTEQDVREEAGAIIDEQASRENSPEDQIAEVALENLFPMSSFRSVLGSKKSIRAISKKDIQDWYKRYYTLSNTVFVITGNFNQKKIEKELEKLTAGVIKGKALKARKEKFKEPKAYSFVKKDISNSIIAVSFRMPQIKEVEKQVLTATLMSALAGSWIGRLNKKLRIEENLTYWVSDYFDMYADVSTVLFRFSAENKNAEKAISLINQELEKIKKDLNKGELENHKNSLTTSTLSDDTDITERIWWYKNIAIHGRGATGEKFLKELKNIKPEKVMSLAKEIFKKENRSITVFSKKDPKISA
ncbi:MAG: pitrilysin family protein [Candidatus Paceibacterota bacterium]